MLTRSFVLLDGVARQRELSLWQQAVLSWNDFLEVKKVSGISCKRKFFFDKMLCRAKSALHNDDAVFFASVLPTGEHWRCYEWFRDDAVFLDIETGSPGNVLVVGLFDGMEVKTLLAPIDKRVLEKELAKYKVIVTFNGSGFDLPVLKKYFGISLDIPHVDLFHVCRKVNITGGLKAIEKKLGIIRPKMLEFVTGQQAAALWRCFHATGNYEFLDMLISYNAEDCANLKFIADKVIPLLWKKTFIF
jgi:uncharacterized protein